MEVRPAVCIVAEVDKPYTLSTRTFTLPSNIIFDGWEPVIRTLIVGPLAYVALVILLRVSGKRTLSKMNAFDFVVTIAFGSVFAAMLTNQAVTLVQGVTALAVLIVLQWIATAIAVRSQTFRSLIKSDPQLIYHRGTYLDDVMRHERVTKQEIIAAMRSAGVSDPDKVDAVVIESEGTLTVLQSSDDQPLKLGELGLEPQKVIS